MPASPCLSLSTFGSFCVRWDGRPMASVGNGKLAALLVYLALEPSQHRREALADLFWPHLAPDSARLNLRQALFSLRSILMDGTGHEFFISGRHRLGFDPDSPFWVDAAAFAAPLPACASPGLEQCEKSCLGEMAELVRLYQGPFLADLTLPDCPGFEDWLHFKREALHRRVLELLMRLVDCHESNGHVGTALPFALRYTELEPWSETGYLRTMQLYARDGRHEAALAQYEACRRVLERELGVLPSAELQALAERLRRGEFAPAQAVVQPIEERRRVTVLYCELNMIGIDDPEDAKDLLAGPQHCCEELVRTYAGHIMQVHGGALLAYFGYPRAVEHSALAAVRAAWMMAASGGPGLEIRVGIHSGPIVAMRYAHTPDPIGLTSSVATHLCAHAGSGEVLLSAEAQAGVAGYFRFADLGHCKLLGRAQTVHVFKVVGESEATHRLAAAERLTPLVGRESELAHLFQAEQRARNGEFQALLISGDAGIGKSRLVRTLTDMFAGGPGIVHEMRCFPETMQSPLHPVIALYESLCGFELADAPEARRIKLNTWLQAQAPGLAERGLPLLAQMLNLPADSRSAPLASTLGKVKEATYAMLVDVFHSIATRHAVLLVVEDLHWADPSTLELLSLLIAPRPSAPMLVLLTTRSEAQPAWPGLERIALAPLSDAAVAAIVGALCADMGPERLAHIVGRADGIPLFAEELAMIAKDGELPTSLHDLLAVHLDRLGPALAVARLAATIGREFEADFLRIVSDLAPEELAVAIDRLLDSGLVLAMANRKLQFRHALVQEAAYQSQPREVRQAAHLCVAQALERGYGDVAECRPEVLARHWSAGGEATAAIRWWLAAGQRAAGHFAHREAVSHYEEGLLLVPKLAPGLDRDNLEFALLVNLARSEQSVSGYGQGRSGKLLARGIDLLEQGAGGREDLFNAIFGLWEGSGSRDGHDEAVRLAERLVDLAEKENNPVMLQQGHYALGNSLFWTGNLAQARWHLERSIALDTGDVKHPTRDCYGRHLLIAAQIYLAWVLWLQGYPEQAVALADEAIGRARGTDNDFDLAFALTFATVLQRWLGHIDASARLAEEGYAVSVTCQSAIFIAVHRMALSFAAVMRGDATAVAAIEQSVAGIRSAMSGIAVWFLASLAEALLHIGDAGKALVVVDEALQQVEVKQDRHYLAELHRLQGLCLLAQGLDSAARACFEKAMAVSQAQGAVAFELRAREALGSMQ